MNARFLTNSVCFIVILSYFFMPTVFSAELVGDGPSLLENGPREGKVVSPSILSGSDAKLFRPRMIWADSWLYSPLPILNEKGEIQSETEQSAALSAVERIKQFIKIEEWYNHAPEELEGKFVMIEFSASWCPACKRATPEMERWNQKFAGRLVVISVFETGRAQMDNFPMPGEGKKLQHCIGIDTQRRSAKALGVYGIPHTILIEPQYGAVVWEGMTQQKEYELIDQTIEKYLEIGEKNKK